MELSALDCKSIRLFVLDEADKLMEESFQEQIKYDSSNIFLQSHYFESFLNLLMLL